MITEDEYKEATERGKKGKIGPGKIDMRWEWNWPKLMANNGDRFSIINFDIDIRWKGDHSPSLYVHINLMGIRFLDFGYYNRHHTECLGDCNEN